MVATNIFVNLSMNALLLDLDTPLVKQNAYTVVFRFTGRGLVCVVACLPATDPRTHGRFGLRENRMAPFHFLTTNSSALCLLAKTEPFYVLFLVLFGSWNQN
jgi:hypothetical protein